MHKLLIILILALLFTGFTGCGHKAPPKPPPALLQ